MEFDFRKLGEVDMAAPNIFNVSAPLYLIAGENRDVKRNKVVFFGNCFKNLPRDIDLEEYIKTTNKCLDFVRRECAGYELIYKPHPAETDEFKLLNLESFEVEQDKTVAEFYLYQNLSRIKYVFSAHSTASVSALSLGLNSYVFFRLLRYAFGDFTNKGFESLLRGMPESYFISDFHQKLQENKIIFAKNDALEKQWAKLLDKNKGEVWFVTDDPGFLVAILPFVKLIKVLSPGRRVGFFIIRITRWDTINIDDLKREFDDIVFSPRVFYSLKPWRMWTLVKTAFAVRRFKIQTGDIIFGVGPEQFQINCFVSYFKKNLRVGLITQVAFDLSHNFATPPKNSDYSIKPQRLFFINFVEPLLGLYHTVGRLQRPGDRGGLGIARYWRPLNEVFDIVYIVKPVDLRT